MNRQTVEEKFDEIWRMADDNISEEKLIETFVNVTMQLLVTEREEIESELDHALESNSFDSQTYDAGLILARNLIAAHGILQPAISQSEGRNELS